MAPAEAADPAASTTRRRDNRHDAVRVAVSMPAFSSEVCARTHHILGLALTRTLTLTLTRTVTLTLPGGGRGGGRA